eukprot:TRINITY_DN2904_c0_g1_i1.p1 TRINITY_DN2904_c0_g1~~TRINITY_DN2904_c0_g1_i1.p1  ORF type:complete len:273 (+),score=76.24 TRINITY_DN2904_c0_g1_i1:45-821(+)
MDPLKGQRVAFVTGATSGIGLATAELFCKNGIAVIACGRRQDRLVALQKKMAGAAPVYPLCFDVVDHKSLQRVMEHLPRAWRSISILVNNAGNAHGLDSIQGGAVSDWEAMLDINLKGLLYVTKEVLPMMPRNKDSVIVNIGSIAGKEAYPNGNVYCATKAAVDQLTKAMRYDLYKEGVRVAAMHPGLVSTEFSEVRFKGDSSKAEKVYQGYRPLTAEDCADSILYMVTRPAHVNVADLLLLPTDQAGARDVNKTSKL